MNFNSCLQTRSLAHSTPLRAPDISLIPALSGHHPIGVMGTETLLNRFLVCPGHSPRGSVTPQPLLAPPLILLPNPPKSTHSLAPGGGERGALWAKRPVSAACLSGL